MALNKKDELTSKIQGGSHKSKDFEKGGGGGGGVDFMSLRSQNCWGQKDASSIAICAAALCSIVL